MLHIVLYEPEIPPNTGNIGRLCHAAGLKLHLIEPLGFSLDEKSLRRAGLDYWTELDVSVWKSYGEWVATMPGSGNTWFLTTKTAKAYWNETFTAGDRLVFGPETRGLPESLLEKHQDSCLTIPQVKGRSLNLATSVGIVAYEGLRQIEMAQIKPF